MKKWMPLAAFLGLFNILACDSNNPAGPAGSLNPPGPNPSPTFQGIIFELEKEGAKFRLAAFAGDTINVRTDKNTQISREGDDTQLQPADLREGDEASIEGVFQGSQKEITVRAEYILLHITP